MRNALQPTVAVVGTQVGYLFSGLIGLEMIFNYPGLGRLIYNAATAKDFPLLAAGVILVGIIYMLCTLFADLVIAWMNPRARSLGVGMSVVSMSLPPGRSVGGGRRRDRGRAGHHRRRTRRGASRPACADRRQGGAPPGATRATAAAGAPAELRHRLGHPRLLDRVRASPATASRRTIRSTTSSTPSQPPSAEHLFGTDQLGRDVLSRVMAGARDVLIAAPIAAVLSVVGRIPARARDGLLPRDGSTRC